jgi:hypothetical protein
MTNSILGASSTYGAESAIERYTKTSKAFESTLGTGSAFGPTAALGAASAFDTSSLLTRMTSSIVAASHAGGYSAEPELIALDRETSGEVLDWLDETPFSLERAKYFCAWLAALHTIGLVLEWYLMHRVEGRHLILEAIFTCLIVALHHIRDPSA